MLRSFAAGYISGLATAAFFVLNTSSILGDLKDIDEFMEWKKERDKETVDGEAKEILPET